MFTETYLNINTNQTKSNKHINQKKREINLDRRKSTANKAPTKHQRSSTARTMEGKKTEPMEEEKK